jgi:hypothetical protein
MASKTIYNLELHEVIILTVADRTQIAITKVPGGWVYTTTTYVGEKEITSLQSSVFVPYNDEFKKGPENLRLPLDKR